MFKLHNPAKALVKRQGLFTERDYLTRPYRSAAIYPNGDSKQTLLSQTSGLLKQTHEKEGGFKYDLVMHLRFDLGVIANIKFEDYDPTHIPLVGTPLRYDDDIFLLLNEVVYAEVTPMATVQNHLVRGWLRNLGPKYSSFSLAIPNGHSCSANLISL